MLAPAVDADELSIDPSLGVDLAVEAPGAGNDHLIHIKSPIGDVGGYDDRSGLGALASCVP